MNYLQWIRSHVAKSTAAWFAALYLLFAFTSLLWVRLNKAPPNWDDAWYLSNSLTLYDAWSDTGLIGLARQFLASLGFKAPLITALPVPFYWLFGRRWHVAYLVDTVAMLVLFASVWAIANRLRGPRAGLVAVWIAGTLPLLYGLSRWYLVEYPLAALVAVSFWLALVAGKQEGWAVPLTFGMVSGLGLLLKADFPLFIAPMLPLLTNRPDKRMRTLWMAAVPALLIAGPWYLLHWRDTLLNAIAAGFGPSAVIQGTGAIFSFSALSKYLAIVSERGVSAYYLGLTALSVAVIVGRRRFEAFRAMPALLLWLAPFVVFAFGGNKDVRYIAPILPAFAVGLACLLDSAVQGRRWLLGSLLVFPAVSLLAVSFGWPYHTNDIGYAADYGPYEWRQDELLGLIAGNAMVPHADRNRLLLGTDRGMFNADNFHLFALQNRLPLRVETTAYGQTLNDLMEQARGADYFVYKEGGEAESSFFNTHGLELRKELAASQEWAEIPFGKKLPDGGTAHILRHLRPNR